MGVISAEEAPVALVVDDDPLVRRTLAALLARLGFAPLQAASAAGAFASLASRRPHLVVSDLELAGPRDGLEIIAEARRLLPEARIVLVTGAGDASFAEAKRRGCDACLPKPFTWQALVEAIGSHAPPGR